VPNGTHFNVQLGGTANLNIKLPQGRHWRGVVSPHQQTAQTGPDGVSGSPSPHVAPGNLPTRTPSANGTPTMNRAGSIGVPPQVGQLQYATPHMQHSSPSPLPSSVPLPSHQSPPRPPPVAHADHEDCLPISTTPADSTSSNRVSITTFSICVRS
jgi:enhancer of polycomb-like protein